MNKYLNGTYAPVEQEITATDFPVIGVLPKDLNGRYLRNGPNPFDDADSPIMFGATIKHDLVTGERTAFDHGAGRGADEPVFVARPSATAEDDGWLLMFMHSHDARDSSFVVLDAQDIMRGPMAEVKLPQRVPYGFHGNRVSDRSVPPAS